MICLDMDGFMGEYEYEMYQAKNPAWNEVGSHCFSTVKVDKQAHDIVKRLSLLLPEDLYVLTSVYGGNVDVRNEQIFDKMQWIKENYPFLNLCNFIACDSGKRDVMSRLKGLRLTRADILIDDYKKNLFAWVESGGTAIKYVNGVNELSDWPGPYIAYYMETKEAVDTILKVWYEAHNG